jgi:hypothetical protein
MSKQEDVRKFTNLDNDTSIETWSIGEIAEGVMARVKETTGEDVNRAYGQSLWGLERKLAEFVKNLDLETPKPSMVFRGASYWSPDTIDAWVQLLNEDKAAKLAKNWSKEELVQKAASFMARESAYSDTKIANRDAYNRAEAVMEFIQTLDEFGIVDETMEDAMRTIVNRFKSKSGLR